MLVLALETTAGDVSAALLEGDGDPEDEPLAGAAVEAAGSGDRLIGLVRQVFEEAGAGFADLAAIAVNRGPGSFTGVRTGVAAARALALATARPVLAVTSFEALAGGVRPQGPGTLIVAAIDARRGQIYVQAFTGGLEALAAPRALAPEEALLGVPGRVAVAGSGSQLLIDAAPDRSVVRVTAARLDACAVGRAAMIKMRAGLAPEPGFTLEPLYLRPPDARPKRPMFER